jgi:hypothetical protein
LAAAAAAAAAAANLPGLQPARRRATTGREAAASFSFFSCYNYCSKAAMLTYLPLYRVLICDKHQHAIYSLDKHLKQHYKLPIAQRRELLLLYSSYTFLPPD